MKKFVFCYTERESVVHKLLWQHLDCRHRHRHRRALPVGTHWRRHLGMLDNRGKCAHHVRREHACATNMVEMIVEHGVVKVHCRSAVRPQARWRRTNERLVTKVCRTTTVWSTASRCLWWPGGWVSSGMLQLGNERRRRSITRREVVDVVLRDVEESACCPAAAVR